MEVKSTDGSTQTALCALIEFLLSMKSVLERKKKGKTQDTVSGAIKHSEHKSGPATQAALEETLCPRVGRWQCGGEAAGEFLGRTWLY